MINKLPTELLVAVFSYLDFDSCNKFRLLSKQFNSIFKDTNARAHQLLKYYGKGQVLYKSFENTGLGLDEQLALVLLANQCNLPRFLAQIVVQRVMIC